MNGYLLGKEKYGCDLTIILQIVHIGAIIIFYISFIFW